MPRRRSICAAVAFHAAYESRPALCALNAASADRSRLVGSISNFLAMSSAPQQIACGVDLLPPVRVGRGDPPPRATRLRVGALVQVVAVLLPHLADRLELAGAAFRT